MSKYHLFAWFAVIALATFSPTTGYSGVITFETVPGVGTPSEGLEISTEFLSTEGVRFSLEGGGFPRIAEVGAPVTAFAGPPNSTGADNPLPGQNIGTFFLTDDGSLGGLFSPPLLVSYDSPTAAASGVILDIDFDETFTIEARDLLGNTLEAITITAGDPSTGDGVATFWSFDRGINEIYSLRFVGTRQAAGAFGLGFDNFNARAIPEPHRLVIWCIGLTAISACRSRRPRV